MPGLVTALMIFLCAVFSGVQVSAEIDLSEDYYAIEPADSGVLSYSDYYEMYSCENRPCKEIFIQASPENTDYTFYTGETGIYCLNITYTPLKSTGNSPIELSLRIDGILPYDTADRITLNRVWMNETDISTDTRGNQVLSAQVQTEMQCSCFLGDSDGIFNDPLIFYLEKGKHSISFISEDTSLIIESFSFCNPEPLEFYSDYAPSETELNATPSNLFRVEGESAVYRSDSSLCPAADRSGYLVSPSDPCRIMYNTIGGENWNRALQSVTWTIPAKDIKNDGWYKIGIKARQNYMRGLYSNRRIYIDGKIPCRELNQVKFYYSSDWSIVSPEAYVYLTADTEHTLTMEVIPGDIGEIVRRLEPVAEELNEYYRKILMITGPSPDKYTDYYVHEKIPELSEVLERLSGELKALQSEIEQLSDSAGSEAAVLERAAVILDKCIEKPLKIPEYLGQIKENITSLSAWLRDCRSQPLAVDYIEFATADREFSSVKENFFKAAAFGWSSFIGSFFEDYSTLSDVTGEDALEVWVALGRDQAQIVRELTENQFMPQYGIPVSIELVSGGITEACLAGKAPDAALFLGGEYPVNLAARGLLAEVSCFPDYEEVKQRFQKNAMTQYTYNNKVYGLPVSQVFPMLFYRTDILSELGYSSPPETWDELIEMLPALQRNYMSAGLVLPTSNPSPVTESGHTFAMMLLQQGAGYYNDTLDAAVLNSTESVNSFKRWTDFYTDYGFEPVYDAFSRFRTGEYPLVIADYTFYNQLYEASPEIRGLWNFVQVPGSVRSDGTISHAANSSGSGAVIFSSADNIENAWQFIKWFTDTETQIQYADRTEALTGIIGRFDTANIDALAGLSWSTDAYRRLCDQQEELEEIPVLPSSYAVTRGIMNAFYDVIYSNENPRDTLIQYNRDINEEMQRKNEELE